jgi:hypothetical protein
MFLFYCVNIVFYYTQNYFVKIWFLLSVSIQNFTNLATIFYQILLSNREVSIDFLWYNMVIPYHATGVAYLEALSKIYECTSNYICVIPASDLHTATILIL